MHQVSVQVFIQAFFRVTDRLIVRQAGRNIGRYSVRCRSRLIVSNLCRLGVSS